MTTLTTTPPADELDGLAASVLNALFEDEVCHGSHSSAWQKIRAAFARTYHVPDFVHNANVVLHYLQGKHWTVEQTSVKERPLRVRLAHANGPFGEDATFARAAVIALIRYEREKGGSE